MSRVKITGMNQLVADLEKRLGNGNVQRITDKALIEAAKVFVKELQTQVKTFSDGKGFSEGHSYDEITMSDIVVLKGVRTIRIHWKGPNQRYRIIHLNEWGTINNPNPRGKGAIAKAMKNSEKAYREAIKKAIKAGV